MKVSENRYTAIIEQRDEWWIGWIAEVPGVNCQEKTKDELVETLRVTLSEIREINRARAIDAADGAPYEILDIQAA